MKFRDDEMALRIVAARRAGLTYPEISRTLRVPVSTACNTVKRYFEAVRSEAKELVADMLELELERLDSLYRVSSRLALDGDMAAVGKCLDIIEKRTKLLGLGQQQPAPELKIVLPEQYTPRRAALSRAIGEADNGDNGGFNGFGKN